MKKFKKSKKKTSYLLNDLMPFGDLRTLGELLGGKCIIKKEGE